MYAENFLNIEIGEILPKKFVQSNWRVSWILIESHFSEMKTDETKSNV